jgi:AbrB family looped-hinge helix DNA binding protein
MHVKIDQAGRIVLPKKIRDRFGLRKNSELELKESAEGIVLKPVSDESCLMLDKDGWLVFTGRPIGKINWDRLVDDMREERIREIGGW